SEAGIAKVVAGKQKAENKAAEKEKRAANVFTAADLSAEETRWAAGASNELGERYASSGIESLNEFCANLGATKTLTQMLKTAGLAGKTIRIHEDIELLEKLARS